MARHALGKGLSALIRDPEPEVKPAPPAAKTGGAIEVDIDLIDPNPFQPRSHFAEQALEELAQSISRTGLLQPVLLRPMGARYQLIAGERRWRAAQRAGLHRIPALFREVPDELALEMTLVENLQREDLNPIEQARAFERLMTEFRMTQEEVATRAGKERSTVTNLLRLLMLEPPIVQLIEEGRLTAGHGRALLMIPDTPARFVFANRAAANSMSVRELERLASQRKRPQQGSASPAPLDANTRAAMEQLQRDLGTRVILRPKTSKSPGRLIIEYYDNEQLIALYERLRSR